MCDCGTIGSSASTLFLRAWRIASSIPAIRQLVVIELSQIAVEIEHQNGDQHQHAADQREEEELDRRVFAPRSAPDADQEIHRQQHDFPEDVEQEEIECQKDAHHARFQQQEQDAVGLHMLVDLPTRGHRQHAENGRQDDQRKADAVEAHHVVDVERRDPVDREEVLHLGDAALEIGAEPPTEERDRSAQARRVVTASVINRITSGVAEQRQHQRTERRQEHEGR